MSTRARANPWFREPDAGWEREVREYERRRDEQLLRWSETAQELLWPGEWRCTGPREWRSVPAGEDGESVTLSYRREERQWNATVMGRLPTVGQDGVTTEAVEQYVHQEATRDET